MEANDVLDKCSGVPFRTRSRRRPAVTDQVDHGGETLAGPQVSVDGLTRHLSTSPVGSLSILLRHLWGGSSFATSEVEAAYDKRHGVELWWGTKCQARYGSARGDGEGRRPAYPTRGARCGPPPGHMAGNNQIGRHEAAPRRQEAAHYGRGRGERRVGHDVEGTPREPEVAGVGLDDGHGRIHEPTP